MSDTYRSGIGGTPNTVINNRRKAEKVVREANKITKQDAKTNGSKRGKR